MAQSHLSLAPASPLLEGIAPARNSSGSLPPSWLSGLERLESVCLRRAEAERQRRALVIEACSRIAHHLGQAGFSGVPLPRGYEVRHIDREWLLIKCTAPGGEVEFVASGQESLWTRLGLQTDRLSEAQVTELAQDLESGLIEEIVRYVEAGMQAEEENEDSAPSLERSPGAGPGRLQIMDLGRPRRRAGRPAGVRRRA